MGTLNCGMWDLVPWPGIEPGPPTLEVRNLSHWTTREVSELVFFFFPVEYFWSYTVVPERLSDLLKVTL